MNRNQYHAAIRAIMDQAYAIHAQCAATMHDLGPEAIPGIEWATVHQMMTAVGLVTELGYTVLYPRPSALTEAAAMVCTACREPVSEHTNTNPDTLDVLASWWEHDDMHTGQGCAVMRDFGPVTAMAAAGSESVPRAGAG